jgi:hypothetical protein
MRLMAGDTEAAGTYNVLIGALNGETSTLTFDGTFNAIGADTIGGEASGAMWYKHV